MSKLSSALTDHDAAALFEIASESSGALARYALQMACYYSWLRAGFMNRAAHCAWQAGVYWHQLTDEEKKCTT